jgi:hypothetical protein
MRIPRHSHFRALASVAIALALVACGDSTGPTEASIAGTYNLQSVNGLSVPLTVFQFGEDKLEITAGSLTLHANNTFSSQLTMRITEDGEVVTESDSATGTYTRNGNSLVFAADGETITGTISGNTITVSDDGLVLVFVK